MNPSSSFHTVKWFQVLRHNSHNPAQEDNTTAFQVDLFLQLFCAWNDYLDQETIMIMPLESNKAKVITSPTDAVDLDLMDEEPECFNSVL